MAERWGTLNDLVATSGLARRTLQYIAKQEPGVLVTRERAGKIQYDLGGCNINLRKREREDAEKKARANDDGGGGGLESLAAAEKRKAIAEASLAELKLQKEQRAVIPLEDHLREVDNLLMHLRGKLIAHPKTREVAPELLAALRIEAPPELDPAAAESNAA